MGGKKIRGTTCSLLDLPLRHNHELQSPSCKDLSETSRAKKSLGSRYIVAVPYLFITNMSHEIQKIYR